MYKKWRDYMSIEWIEILGLRGFSEKRRLDLAIPNGKEGGGLTTIVGPNNSGKTTIVEAFNALTKSKISFSEDKRNKIAQDLVEIVIKSSDHGENIILKSIERGSSEVTRLPEGQGPFSYIFVLPSRRTFPPFFYKDKVNRETYITQFGYTPFRPREINDFCRRLFDILENENKKKEFNRILEKILGSSLGWTIDQTGAGNYYLKFKTASISHTSDGLGEGIISLFIIVDALRDLEEVKMIVIDEPELSLHPSLQKRLMKVFSECAKDRQIVLATHSPYFIEWEALFNGAKLIRTVRESEGINIYTLQKETLDELERLVRNVKNPHILGQNAKEIFFLEDNVVLLEGQEDVVYYKKILDELEIIINGEFFGWGVGGAENMEKIANALKDLGFKKVVGILDKDKESFCERLSREFKRYKFFVSPAEDVKTKGAKKGIIDENCKIRDEYRECIRDIFCSVDSYFREQ
jgi:AAA15 family ATPase/GTPase/5S rRNA maturation endonuclease (ribonuclease M5)